MRRTPNSFPARKSSLAAPARQAASAVAPAHALGSATQGRLSDPEFVYSLMCGFFSIIATFHGEYVNAALLILLANVFDGVDGYVARLTRTTSQFGVEFDSLAMLSPSVSRRGF